ncbi:MAG: iron-sulfur cluster assembly scaffold protein [Promethearchaeota archaeon]
MSEEEFNNSTPKRKKVINEKEIEEYNQYIIDLIHSPKNWGKPSEDEITISHSYKGPCGDTMQFFLKINNNVIEKANFITDGCGASIATASQVTLLIKGRPLNYIKKLKPKDIDMALKGLPEDHKHCTELAVRTLNQLIKKYKNEK